MLRNEGHQRWSPPPEKTKRKTKTPGPVMPCREDVPHSTRLTFMRRDGACWLVECAAHDPGQGGDHLKSVRVVDLFLRCLVASFPPFPLSPPLSVPRSGEKGQGDTARLQETSR